MEKYLGKARTVVSIPCVRLPTDRQRRQGRHVGSLGKSPQDKSIAIGSSIVHDHQISIGRYKQPKGTSEPTLLVCLYDQRGPGAVFFQSNDTTLSVLGNQQKRQRVGMEGIDRDASTPRVLVRAVSAIDAAFLVQIGSASRVLEMQGPANGNRTTTGFPPKDFPIPRTNGQQ